MPYATMGILIGGHSQRMGRPKALIEVEGVALIERTVGVARCMSEEVVLLGTPPFALPTLIADVPIIPDRPSGVGPLGGLSALLAARPEADCIMLACDMPHLDVALLRRLAVGEVDCDAVVCRATQADVSDGPQWHPCCGLYRPSALPAVQAALVSGRYGLRELLKKLRVRPVDLVEDEARWVENWNAPEDLMPPNAVSDNA